MKKLLAAMLGSLVVSPAAFAGPNLIADPGFELNNGGWISSSFYLGDSSPRSGANSASTGCVGYECVSTLGTGAFIQQTLGTTVGQAYTLSFFVGENASGTSEFSVFWDGVQTADQLNPANSSLPSYVEYTFNGLSASSTETVLEVHGRQDPGGIFFDDFSVTEAMEVPEPASLALVSLGMLGLGVIRRKCA